MATYTTEDPSVAVFKTARPQMIHKGHLFQGDIAVFDKAVFLT